jgi:hypothetical protein
MYRKLLFIAISFVIAKSMYSQPDNTLLTVFVNDQKVSIDTVRGVTTPSVIQLFDNGQNKVISMKVDIIQLDSIVVSLYKTDFYPEHIICANTLLDDEGTCHEIMSLRKSAKFLGYNLNEELNDDGRVVFTVTFEFRKRFRAIDLTIFGAVRHFFTDKETVSFIKT